MKGISDPVQYDPDKIPAEWRGWLAHTRKDAPSVFELDQDVGLSNIPNRRLFEAKRRRQSLNLVLIGPAGCGKSTLINALACREFLPPARPRYPEGSKSCEMREYHTTLEEGGVQMDLSVTEVLGYGEASGDSFKSLVESICEQLRQPLDEQLQLEYAEIVPPKRMVTRLVHAVLFVIPPNMGMLSGKDLEFLQAVSRFAFVIPILGKADCYTPEELQERKHQIRRTLELADLSTLPADLDPFYGEVCEEIDAKWPLATIASTKLAETSEGTKRVRAYPWGNIDVDDDTFNDLGLLQKLLFSKLHVKLHKHAAEQIYELYRQVELPRLESKTTPDALYKRLQALATREATPENSPETCKIDIAALKALERQKQKGNYDEV